MRQSSRVLVVVAVGWLLATVAVGWLFVGLVDGFRVLDRQAGLARVVWSALATFAVSGLLLFVAVRAYVGTAMDEGGWSAES